MSGIVDAKVEKYISSLDGKQDSVRRQMEEIARGNGFPIVGPQVGRLLSILARSVNARRILELGSGYGYSALWFARGMQEGGSIDCTDLSTENRDLALRFFREAGIEKFVTFHVGDALEVARAQTGPFDVVFNDIVLWSGKVADQRKADQDTAAIRQFNQMVCSRDDLETVILPLRDGVAVCQKVR